MNFFEFQFILVLHTFIKTGLQQHLYYSDVVRILSIKCPWSPLLLPALTLCSCYRHSLWEMQIYVALRLIIISVHTCWTVSPSINHRSHLSHLYHACFLCPLISSISLVNVSECVLAIHCYTWCPPGWTPFVRHGSHSMARDVKGILVNLAACSNHLPPGDYYCTSPGQ